MHDHEHHRYPIGKFHAPDHIDEAQRKHWISDIESLPQQLSAATHFLNDHQLDTPYREGGWTVRQLVHHVADSHMNAMIRFRWALTEDVPVIKAYDEKLWAELPDAKTYPIDVSLYLIDGLHRRWVALLNKMTEADFHRRLRHPESGETSLDRMLGIYAWHGKHHTAHVTNLNFKP